MEFPGHREQTRPSNHAHESGYTPFSQKDELHALAAKMFAPSKTNPGPNEILLRPGIQELPDDIHSVSRKRMDSLAASSAITE